MLNQRYLIIGNGRLARHMSEYLRLLKISCDTWCRQDNAEALKVKLLHASHVLLLIADKAIENFAKEHLQASTALHIHCSGSHVSKNIFGAHPLYTFGKEQYSLTEYQAIPFIIDEDAPAFHVLLPGFPNPHFLLEKKHRAKYHAMCVMAGNFTCLLWQKLFHTFTTEFGMNADIAHPYLERQMRNLLLDHEGALTGPLTRGDQSTIQKHLKVLKNDPFLRVYESFIIAYSEIRGDKK